ncbi:MAG: glycosyltransferase family 4 protein [candidate division WOR-3 bacterium]|jgi:glycosyltransferase involved in cell wall biosynthesis
MKRRNDRNIVMLLSNPFKPDLRVYREAKSLVDLGYNVTIVAWDRECRYRTREDISGVQVRRIRIQTSYGTGLWKIRKLLLYWLSAARVAKNERFKVIHCHDLDTLIVGVFLRVFYKKLLIYDSHEKFSLMVLMNSPKLVSFFVEMFERLMIRFVDAIIVASTKLGNELKARVGDKVTVVGNWQENVPLNRRQIASIRKRYGKGYKLLIAYIGFLDKSRELIPPIEAVKSIPEVKFIICGEGVQKSRIQEVCADADNVSYLGLIPLSMVPYYTAAADVICYILNDSQPISAYQAPNSLGFALIRGRAVLGSNHGEIGPIVDRYRCGILVKDNSPDSIAAAISELLNKRVLHCYQKNALAAGQKYCNWTIMVQRLRKLYQNLLPG